MSKIVHKFPIGDAGPKIPLSAKVLYIGIQKNEPFAWCEMESGYNASEHSEIKIIPTGVEFDSTGLSYLGTLQFLEGNFVVHFYRTN